MVRSENRPDRLTITCPWPFIAEDGRLEAFFVASKLVFADFDNCPLETGSFSTAAARCLDECVRGHSRQGVRKIIFLFDRGLSKSKPVQGLDLVLRSIDPREIFGLDSMPRCQDVARANLVHHLQGFKR